MTDQVITDIVTNFLTPGADDLAQVFETLNKLQDVFKGKTGESLKSLSAVTAAYQTQAEKVKKATFEMQEAQEKLDASKKKGGTAKEKKESAEAIDTHSKATKQMADDYAKVTAELLKLKAEFKNLQLNKSAIEFVSNKEIDKLRQAMAMLEGFGKEYRALQKLSSLATGTFGLDSKNLKENQKSITELKKYQESLKGALNQPANDKGGLLQSQSAAAQNLQALEARGLEFQAKLDHAQSKKIVSQLEEDQALTANQRLGIIEKDRVKLNADQALLENKTLGDIKKTRTKLEESEALSGNKRLGEIEKDRVKLNADQALLENKTLGDIKKTLTKLEESEALLGNKRLGAIESERQKLNSEQLLLENKNAGAIQKSRTKLEESEALSRNKRLGEIEDERVKLNAEQALLENKNKGLIQKARAKLEDDEALARNKRERDQERVIKSQQEREDTDRLNQSKRLSSHFGPTEETYGGSKFAKFDPTANAAIQSAQQKLIEAQTKLAALSLAQAGSDKKQIEYKDDVLKKQIALNEEVSKEKENQNRIKFDERIRSKLGGEGGANLLTVQASLMANYAVLNTAIGGVKAAVNTSIELEAAFKNVQAVTATTSTEMVGLESNIKSVAAASKFSSAEVAQAALTLGQAGFSAKQIAEAIPAVAMLASAAGSTMAQSVDLVTSVIGVFDKKASDTVDIINKITQAANSSKVSVEKLSLGFQYVGNIAAQSGITFEEVTASMAAMSNAGIKSGSTMGTGLRQFITEVEKPSEQFLASLTRIGLSLSDLDFKTKGLIGVAKTLRDSGFSIDDSIKGFDTRTASAFNALIANPEDLDRQYKGLMETKAGLAANDIQMDSLKSQATRLQTSLENLASAGFAPLGTLLKTLFSGFATLTQAASEHSTILGGVGLALGFLATAKTAVFLASLAQGFMVTSTSAGITTTVLQIFGVGAVEAGAGAATGAVGVGLLTVALAALKVVAGFGVLTAIGALISVGLDAWADKGAQSVDALKAKVNESTSAFEEKTSAVKTLDGKIESLISRHKTMAMTSDEVKEAEKSLAMEMGQLGGAIDSSNGSFEVMIANLREVRSEMSKIAQIKLNNAIRESQAVVNETSVQLTAKVEAVNSKRAYLFGGVPVDILQNFLSDHGAQIKADPNYNKMEFATLTKGLEELKKKDINSMTNAMELPGLIKLLQENKSLKLSEAEQNKLSTFQSYIKDLPGLYGQYRPALSTLNQQEDTSKNTKSMEAFKSLPLLKSKSFQDITEGNPNYEQQLKASNKDISRIELAKQTKALVSVRNEELEQARESIASRVKTGELDKVTANTAIARLNLLQSENLAQTRKSYTSAGDSFDLADKKAAMVTDSNLKKLLSEKVFSAEKVLAELTTKYDRKFEADLRNKLKGGTVLTKKDEAELRESGKIELDNEYQTIVNNKTKNPSHRGENTSDNEAIRSLQKKSKGQLDEAALNKKYAEMLTDIDDVEAFVTKGVEAIKKAKGYALEAEKKQQHKAEKGSNGATASMRTEWADNIVSIEKEFNDKISQYTIGVKGFAMAGARQLTELTHTMKEKEKDLQNLKMAGEDRVYEAGSNLRELELEQALGKRYKGGKSKSMTTPSTEMSWDAKEGKYLLKPGTSKLPGSSGDDGAGLSWDEASGRFKMKSMAQRIGEATIAKDKVELEEIDKHAELLRGLIESTKATLAGAKPALEAINAEIQVLADKLKNGKLSDEEKGRYAKLLVEKKDNEDLQDKSSSSLYGKEKDLRSLRGERSKIEVNIAQNTEKLPQELNLDNLEKKMEHVWATWKENVSDMDALKHFGDGLSGIFSGVTTQLGQTFMAIETRTMSAKEAFRSMAASIVKSLLEVINQMIAMQAMKALIGMVGSIGGAAAGGAIGSAIPIAPTIDAPGLDMSTVDMSAMGGYVAPVADVAKESGGIVSGLVDRAAAIPSNLAAAFTSPAAITAGAAVGGSYLSSLNKSTANVVSSNTANSSSNSAQKSGGSVNVYVVSPDQQPATSPTDIVATISDDINRGGSIKQLIKQVQMGN